MEVEVMVPGPPAAVDFNFDSTCSSPYMTAPSSPQRFGNYFFSAPTSPSARAPSNLYCNFPEQSGIYKAKEEEGKLLTDDDQDFEFNFSGPLHVPSISAADELFDGGKIRPLRPHSFAANSTRKTEDALSEENTQTRGRQRSSGSSSSSTPSNSSYSRRESRSLPPLRVSDVLIEQEEITENTKAVISKTSNSKSYASAILSAISFSKGYKKWKLKDLLFRSASEGREPLTKYSVLNRREPETADAKNASFRSTEGSVGSVSRRRGPPVSAHELHYTTNRAVSEELKRKTYLPYNRGLLGCLGFNPAGMHDISRGVGSLTRG
ncbi:hypothetical protein HS088_TW02G00228 [Tripterygium wilfordii]|uniref:Calmodulin-binding protein n=1 Tax=Tripterygium wilfordii TaxID=458696 RepID=A0A7J7DXW0_TRIWF|nr:uncharacterized protein LOC120005823 [Tripterygium wilfordii]KAF5751218.1 hypothetical protein HS088_TW02G00228 [Tripterygium wilfordii]